MVKLSDVKVVPQYRERVRRRLLVLAYAGEHGPTVAGRRYGMSPRTVRRWRKRWRADGLQGLVPRYPRRRSRRVRSEVLELVRQARQDLGYAPARTRLWLLRHHGIRMAMATLQRIFVDLGFAIPTAQPQAGTAAAPSFRETRAGGFGPGGREIRQGSGPVGLSIHRNR